MINDIHKNKLIMNKKIGNYRLQKLFKKKKRPNAHFRTEKYNNQNNQINIMAEYRGKKWRS